MATYADQAFEAYLTAIANASRREVIKWGGLGKIYVFKGGGYVKIGYSELPEGRLQTFNDHLPFRLKLIHQLPGTPKTESAVQAVLGKFRIKRDWFRANDSVLDAVSGLQRLTTEDARKAFSIGIGLRHKDSRLVRSGTNSGSTEAVFQE